MTRRGGLGRGLDALLPSSDVELKSGDSPYAEIGIDEISPNPNQPRKHFEDAAAEELTASVGHLGILQPLLVRRKPGGGYELIAGERRWRAAKVAGLARVPVIEVETDDRGALERALVENVHRSDLNPIEEAAAYRQLMDEAGMTQEELGARVGKDRSTIANSLRLLELPPAIQRLLILGRLSAGHGKALLGLTGNPFQERLAQRLSHEAFSVRATEDLVRRYQQMVPSTTQRQSSPPERTASVVEAERRLAEHLKTRVAVSFGKRKGKVVIEFSSRDELDRLLAEILKA